MELVGVCIQDQRPILIIIKPLTIWKDVPELLTQTLGGLYLATQLGSYCLNQDKLFLENFINPFV